MLQLMTANSPKPIPTTGQPALTVAPDLRRIHELTEENRQEALAFLAVRPVHTIVMTSFIHDNGFDQASNRGEFYGYRGIDGKLEGIALIGHSTLFEARTDEAIRAFALRQERLKRQSI